MQKLRSQSRLVICKPASLQIPILLALICFLNFYLVCPAAVIKVPENYSTIQSAIDVASDGDEIIVSPGTYYENINFFGKNITLRSTDPANPDIVATTIIDGNGAGSVVTFSGTELPSCVFSGFTITNGHGRHGGGVYGNGVHATIQNNVISGNSADSHGGGLAKCSGTIKDNIIQGNSADWGGALSWCDGVVQNNIISKNTAISGGAFEVCNGPILDNVVSGNSAKYGGGLSLCNGTIQNNTIVGNSASRYYGGGLYHCDGSIQLNTISSNSAQTGGGLYGCHGTIQHNTIVDNSADDGGGLSWCYGTIENNIISGNMATGYHAYGGGLLGCNGTIRNNKIAENRAHYGGGLYSCNGTIRNNIIRDNTASRWAPSGTGGGLSHCDGTIANNIISANWGSKGGGLYSCDGIVQNNTIHSNASHYGGGGGINKCYGTIVNCIIWGNYYGTSIVDSSLPSYCCIQEWTGGGTGNISSDPQLVDPANGDFHLQLSSPCIDAGGRVTLYQDFEGNPRPWDATSEPRGDGSDFDIGADEYSGLLCYDFSTGHQGWTTGTAVIFSSPQWVFEPGRLKLVAENNTNTFGFWVSPENAIPVSEGYLYRARFTVSTDVPQPEIVPQIRLRVNSRNFQQADCLSIDSSGDGGASPTPEGTTYDLYFVPATNAGYCMLAFDLLNFNPYDAARAELALENVLVDRFALDTLDDSTGTSWTYDFETTQEFWFPGDGTYAFTDPEFFWAEGALHLRSMTNTNTFGFWHSDGIDVIVEENRLYRGTFEVRTDEPDRSRVPQMRLRFNTANMQAARTFEISSIGDGANSPGTTNTTYDQLYFLPPVNCVGSGLIVSFDILNFSPDDATTASLILDRAIIETLSPPALP